VPRAARASVFGAAQALQDAATVAYGDTDGDQWDREERAALRRVPGLSTELEDVTEVEYRQLRLENVVLVGVYPQGSQEDAENSLRELAALAETAGAVVLDGVLQRRPHPDPATYIGRGKAAELRDLVAAVGADTVIADTELAPSQRRALEDVVKVEGHRPHHRHPRHLQPARQEPRGQGAGRARPARVPAASARLG
jgi:GTP-binding protein HflX